VSRYEARQPPDPGSLDAQLAALIGRPVASKPVVVAPDPVNVPMIRHWAAAFEDWNPVYTDPEQAGSSRFGGVVAPPLMLQTWTMATPVITGIAERGGSPVVPEGDSPLTLFDRAGYTATLATNSEFEIVRYLRPGDLVSATTVFESISDEKQTRMGRGRFVTWLTTYTDQNGEVVGRQRFRILKFDPSGGAP
jgi:acyl dehydratase